MAAVAVALGGPVATPAAAQGHLTYASHLPEAHIVHRHGLIPFFEAVAAATRGDIQFVFFTGGSVTSAAAAPSALRGRAIDGAVIDMQQVRDVLPVSRALAALPELLGDARIMTGALGQTLLVDCDACAAEFASAKTVPLGIVAEPPAVLQCVRAVSSLADARGVRVNATPALRGWALAIGMAPSDVGDFHLGEALTSGRVGCTFSPPWQTGEHELRRTVQAVTDVPIGLGQGNVLLALNSESWQSLRPAEKRALLDAAPRAIRSLVQGLLTRDATARGLSAERGVRWLEPDVDLEVALTDHREAEIRAIFDRLKAAGIPGAAQIVDRFVANIAWWRGRYTETDGDPTVFEADLRRQIYEPLALRLVQ